MNSPEDYQAALRMWKEKQRFETETAPPRSVSVTNSISVSIELFGAARLLAKTQTVSLSLPQGATLAHVYSSLADKLPVLVGRVINSEGLISGYACNINGLDFVRAPSAKVNSGDKILILSADAGG